MDSENQLNIHDVISLTAIPLRILNDVNFEGKFEFYLSQFLNFIYQLVISRNVIHILKNKYITLLHDLFNV